MLFFHVYSMRFVWSNVDRHGDQAHITFFNLFRGKFSVSSSVLVASALNI